MHKHTRTVVLLSLLCLLAFSPLLMGCGAVGAVKQAAEAAKSVATLAADELGKEPTGEPSEEPTSEPAEEPGEEPVDEPGAEGTALENTFDNLIKLAPVHMSSAWTTKVGDKVRATISYEADVDANGNQHIKLMSNDQPVEMVIADGQIYMKAEDQFISLGEHNEEGFGFLAVYGGAYLLAFNDLKEAKLVGSEAVGPWQANKYEIQMDLASLGVSGLAAGAQGAEWDYKGTAWIEPNSGALVKAVVDWSGKGIGTEELESWHSEFLASEGTVTEITAPENVVTMG